MSRKRRDDAAETRADRAYSRRNIRAGAEAVWRTPVAFMTEPHAYELLGVLSHETEPTVRMPGNELTLRDRHGRVVFAERAPDWVLSLEAYAQFVTDNPRPLTARQRAKAVRRGK